MVVKRVYIYLVVTLSLLTALAFARTFGARKLG
jgi:hypothetical protein